MILVRVHGECQRCTAKWTARNAQALAAQHQAKTGHLVEVTLTYRSGDGAPRTDDAKLPFGRPSVDR